MAIDGLFIFLMSYILLHIKPGPGQAFRIVCAAEKGFWVAMAASVGVAVSCTIFFFIVALGFSHISEILQNLSFYMKLIGGSYMIYLGVKGFKKQDMSLDKAKKKLEAGHIPKYFLIGLFISLSNPMDILYFASVLPNLVPLGEWTFANIMTGAAIVLLTGPIIDVFILLLVVQTKTAFTETKAASYFSVFANITFILIGLFFLYGALVGDSYQLQLL